MTSRPLPDGRCTSSSTTSGVVAAIAAIASAMSPASATTRTRFPSCSATTPERESLAVVDHDHRDCRGAHDEPFCGRRSEYLGAASRAAPDRGAHRPRAPCAPPRIRSARADRGRPRRSRTRPRGRAPRSGSRRGRTRRRRRRAEHASGGPRSRSPRGSPRGAPPRPRPRHRSPTTISSMRH